MRKYIAIIIASLALFTGQAHAQRCLPKMQGIEVRADMADGFNPGGKDGGYSFGAALSTYTKKGNKWVFGGEYLLKNNPYKDTKIPVAQFTADGGYYFKILSDARKIVFVYAGASALAGYESVNWGKKMLCRHPVHHRLQYHQLYFPRHGRLQKSDVFRCNRLYYQYCA